MGGEDWNRNLALIPSRERERERERDGIRALICLLISFVFFFFKIYCMLLVVYGDAT